MPSAHLLPDFANSRPWYGQNLVELAAALERHQGSAINVLDIGANIGDSAAQIIARTEANVLCVEGDPYWARYLRRNLGQQGRAVIVEALLTPVEGAWAGSTPVRTHGTTRFAQARGGAALHSISMATLRASHPEFDHLRLIKSDTDGFDTALIPAAATMWQHGHPVLFFEFDLTLSRLAGDTDPNAVWGQLAALGYEHLAIWDNTGDPLGRLPIAEAAEAAAVLASPPPHLGYQFWDIAACRNDDRQAIAAFDELVPESYSPLGTWR
jgi:FkbM family methyltransferase